MKNNLPKIFYWCGIELNKETTRREHVPPLGFFPKGYRNNLMTVPACEKHNNHLSHLDEKFQFYLKAHRSNGVANNDFLDTVLRGLRRKEKEGFLKSLNNNTGVGSFNEKPQIFTKLESFETDTFIEKIIRALYFYHKEESTKGLIQWFSKYIHFEGIDSNSLVDSLKEDLNKNILTNGEFYNPEVFKYKFFDFQGLFGVFISFYDDVEFIGWVLPKDFTYDNFDSEKYGYSEEYLRDINKKK